MSITEEEAKTKLCQESFGAPRDHVSFDYLGAAHAMRCQGSACMAWRWLDPEFEHTTTLAMSPPDGDGWKHACSNVADELWQRPTPCRRGYCGKAGKP